MSPRHPDQKIRRILIAGTSWLGDTVLSIPAMYGIRSIFPDARIAVLARQGVGDIYRAVPAVDIVLPHHKKSGIAAAGAVIVTGRMLRKYAFDLAILFTRSCGTALACALAGIPRRLGFASGMRNLLLTEAVPRDSRLLSLHQVHYYKKLPESLGLPCFPALPMLILPDDAKTRARELLSSELKGFSGPLVAINPGSTYGSAKQWLPGRFRELAQRLTAGRGCAVLVVGDRASRKLATDITAGLGRAAIDLTGRTGIVQLAALLACCDVLVTNDTGPMHVACAVGTPVVAVFGSTDPAGTAPLGPDAVMVKSDIDCSPCLRRSCPHGHHKCMYAVEVDAVETAVVQKLKKKV